MTSPRPPLAELPAGAPARLAVGAVEAGSLSLGAFQRARSCLSPEGLGGRALSRRRSGGPTLVLAPGSVRVQLALSSPSALVPDADVPRLLNRHVRPLLRALTKLGALPRYGGRDFVSAGSHVVAWVGFAHHQGSGAALFEALVAVEEALVLPASLDGYPHRREPPYMGKKAGSLRDVTARSRSSAEVVAAIEAAYRSAYGELPALALPGDVAVEDEAPFVALEEEAIGFVGATGDALGGDMMASEDLIAALSARLPMLPRGASEEDVRRELGRAAEEVPGFVEGIRDLGAIARVVARAIA